MANLIFFLLLSCEVLMLFSINDSIPTFDTNNFAELLVGTPSSYFSDAGFINFLLYGHSDLSFTFLDFLRHFGTPTSDLGKAGSLIIGNDTKLGGIIDFNKVVIPIPWDKIHLVDRSDLLKYFPRGYTIFNQRNPYDNIFGSGKEVGTFGTNGFCYSCDIILYMKNYTGILNINNGFWLQMANPSTHNGNIDMFGFLLLYDPITMTGKFKITFYETQFYGVFERKYYILDDSHKNDIYFSIENFSVMRINGSIFIDWMSDKEFYNFTGNISISF